ncbi:MAG: hypothetical protein IJQ37_07280 [Clostridia bacterium]|nr:hypothetical protein [Clostridia bacterium]
MNKKVKMYLNAAVCLLLVFSVVMLVILLVNRNKYDEERRNYASEIASYKEKIAELEEKLGYTNENITDNGEENGKK